jgi:SAM-dependent methyltransferase
VNSRHEANRAFWNASAHQWKEGEDKRGLWMRCPEDPTLVLSPAEVPFLSDIRGKDVCVLGSGDNEVAFALAGMGGTVTSVDISERRLEIAEERAAVLGLSMTFVRADVTNLAPIEDAAFDLVYTGGHMSVWVSDIRKYYAEAVRILRANGLLVTNDYHPIRRMWPDSDGPTSCHRYFNRGPYEYRSEAGLPSFEFHWTVADHIQAVLDAGCALVKVDEHGEENEFWTKANLDKLPTYLLIVGRRTVLQGAHGAEG